MWEYVVYVLLVRLMRTNTTKKAIMKQFKCKSWDTLGYASANFRDAILKDNRVYENGNIRV